ncbi:hypothetical protein JOM56_002903 [Amanita muscaria]
MPPSPNITSRLNDDVLREIFIRCIYAPQNLSTCFVVGDSTSSIRNFPQLGVSRVCSSWRHVALLTPQLWNNIMILEITNTNLSIAREYLSRAKNLPVSITFDQCETDKRRSQLTDFLSSYRLRTLKVHTKASSFHLLLPDLPQRSVADLESLMMFNQNILDSERESIDLNGIRYPKLAHVSITGVHEISGYSTSYSTSLRIFDGTGLLMTVTESWNLLSCCPSLEDVRLTIMRGVDISRRPVSVPQIQLQHLRLLCLYSRPIIGEIPFSIFIEPLALPAIEELRVPIGRVAWSSTAFQSLAHRSNYFPRLRDFVLRDPTCVVDTNALLESMPSLKSMSLSLCISSNLVVFDHLALNSLASGLLGPQLQSLSVGYISNEGEFLDMVESRMKNAQMSADGVPAPFTKVEYCTLHYPDVARLHDMQQRGIPIDAT